MFYLKTENNFDHFHFVMGDNIPDIREPDVREEYCVVWHLYKEQVRSNRELANQLYAKLNEIRLLRQYLQQLERSLLLSRGEVVPEIDTSTDEESDTDTETVFSTSPRF